MSMPPHLKYIQLFPWVPFKTSLLPIASPNHLCCTAFSNTVSRFHTIERLFFSRGHETSGRNWFARNKRDEHESDFYATHLPELKGYEEEEESQMMGGKTTSINLTSLEKKQRTLFAKILSPMPLLCKNVG